MHILYIMRILLTGGLGFIGSHVAVTLGQQDHDIIILDNLANSSIDVLFKIKRLENHLCSRKCLGRNAYARIIRSTSQY
jgi:UDP-glucose 4-epimerase